MPHQTNDREAYVERVTQTGKMLYLHRRMRMMTCQQTADSLGISRAQYETMERGVYLPRPEILWGLCTVFGLDAVKLLQAIEMDAMREVDDDR